MSTLIFWSLKKIWHFDKDILKPAKYRKGFTLVEVMAASVILVIIGATVMTVINRCIDDTIDSELKMKAFKIARDNMETLLGEDSVSQMIEFGSLEDNPDIEWELTVEPFSEPVNNEMWMRAVSTASYTAPNGEREYIELTHWLTDLTEKQVKQIQAQQALELELLDDVLVNPYGDDPEGLMMFQESLASEGKFPQAAKIALNLMREFPDSQEALDASKDARIYARKSASFGDHGSVADIVIEIATLLDDPAIEKQCVDDAFKYANDAAKSGDFREAAEIAQKISEKLPENPKAKTAVNYAYGFAKAAATSGDFRAATDIIDDVGISNPDIKPPPEIADARVDDGWDDKAIEQPPDKPTADNGNNNNANRPQWQIDLESGKITFAEAIEIIMSAFK